MKLLKRAGAVLLALPVLLLAFFVCYEVFGACVNHMSTRQQTNELLENLEQEIPDLTILTVRSETGNTSGTGNHVDCLSSVSFSTELRESEIRSRLSKYYHFDEGSCYVARTEDGNYLFYLCASAPFADNIEGH